MLRRKKENRNEVRGGEEESLVAIHSVVPSGMALKVHAAFTFHYEPDRVEEEYGS